MVTIDIPETVCWNEVPDLRMEGDQANFASGSLTEWLRETALVRAQGSVLPFLVREDGVPVGFFALACGETQLSPFGRNRPCTVLLRNFLVIPERQGRGIARVMLDRLPAIVRRYFPEADRVRLAVNLRNLRAQRVYLRHGFVDSGEVWPGIHAGPAHLYDLELGLPRRRAVAANYCPV